jgi:hypothetical protein
MFIPKIIYNYPFVVVMPVQWIEFKMHAPTVTQELNTEAWVTAIGDVVRPLRRHDFYTSELRRHAKVDSRLRFLIGDRNNRELGTVLYEITTKGHSIMGVRLERIGEDRNGAIWLVIFSGS